MKEIKQIFDSQGMKQLLGNLAKEVKQQEAEGEFQLVGILTRGVPIAQRLADLLKRRQDEIGTLDISLYRDDLSTVADMPIVRETRIPFPVQGSRILLIDDVLYTGRTIRSALDALMDLGRPKEIKLLVLVDRGGRELPIQADFCGEKLSVASNEIVKVCLQDVDREEKIVIVQRNADS